MTEDVIKLYDNFNTKVCPDEIIFGDFNYQSIPSEYYNILNDYDDDGNNIPGAPIDNTLLHNKGV